MSSQWVVDVTEANFAREVVERSREVPVVVDFWATWCGPCRVLGPTLEKLVEEKAGGVILAKVDVDRSPALAGAFGVQSVPTVIAVKDGRPLDGFAGALPEPELREFLDQLAPTPAAAAPPASAESEEAQLERTDPAAAEAGYRERLAQEPADEVAATGLARLLIARGDRAEAGEVLQNAAPGDKQKDEIARLQALIGLAELAQPLGDLAAVKARHQAAPDAPAARYEQGVLLAVEGRYPEALEALLEAAQRNKKLAKDKVREAMVHVFHAVGAHSDLANRYREQLALALY